MLKFFIVVAILFQYVSCCMFSLPGKDSQNRSGCYHFDVSGVSKDIGYLTKDKATGLSYLINVCNNIPPPAICPSATPSVGYQIYYSTCYILGHNDTNSTFVLPINPNDPTEGFRLVYLNGDAGIENDAERRSMIIDFICDKDAGLIGPSTISEPLSLHYFVKWPTSAACYNSFVVNEACPIRRYDSTWDSLAYRFRPSWFDDAKFGIFLHWGLFSVPAYKSEWYWNYLMGGDSDVVNFHNRVYGCSGVEPDKYPCTGPAFNYEDFAPNFKAELFDPDQWAEIFKASGAQYVVLTSKHHEGWCNFPSAQHWNWNSVDVGPHRDLVGDLTNSVRKVGLRMGLYHSLREWYNPLYVQDNADSCNTTAFVDQILLPTLRDIVQRYQPEIIWADGSGDAECTMDSVTYWKAPTFLSWLYNDSPVKDSVVVNDRWGDKSIGDYTTGPDRYTPGKLIVRKWESCFTVQASSWGYDRTESLDKYYDTQSLLYQLVGTVSCNGNLLLNVGPTADGRILPIFEERLREMGDWLKVNGEAIYGTEPWSAQNDTVDCRIWYTMAKRATYSSTGPVYGIFFDWPDSSILKLVQIKELPSQVSLLGYSGLISFYLKSDGLYVTLPSLTVNQMPCKYAWTLKFDNIN